MKHALLGLLLLAGCSSHTAWQLSAGTPQPNAPVQVHVHTAAGFAALLGLTVVAASVYETTRGGFDYVGAGPQRPPDMAPDRRVSEQDCTKPLDHSLGNIRCK